MLSLIFAERYGHTSGRKCLLDTKEGNILVGIVDALSSWRRDPTHDFQSPAGWSAHNPGMVCSS